TVRRPADALVVAARPPIAAGKASARAARGALRRHPCMPRRMLSAGGPARAGCARGLLEPLGEPVHAALAGSGGGALVVGLAIRWSLHSRLLERREPLEHREELAPLEQGARDARRTLARRASEPSVSSASSVSSYAMAQPKAPKKSAESANWGASSSGTGGRSAW